MENKFRINYAVILFNGKHISGYMNVLGAGMTRSYVEGMAMESVIDSVRADYDEGIQKVAITINEIK